MNAYINESLEEESPIFSAVVNWAAREHFDDYKEVLRKKSITLGTFALAPGMVKYY